MGKAFLNTALTSATTVAANGIIPAGVAVHGSGSCIKLNGNGITLSGAGQYKITASITAAPTATGGFTATVFNNGVAVSGATASGPEVAAGTESNVCIVGSVYIPCSCSGYRTITFVTDSDITVENMAVLVEKE